MWQSIPCLTATRWSVQCIFNSMDLPKYMWMNREVSLYRNLSWMPACLVGQHPKNPINQIILVPHKDICSATKSGTNSKRCMTCVGNSHQVKTQRPKHQARSDASNNHQSIPLGPTVGQRPQKTTPIVLESFGLGGYDVSVDSRAAAHCTVNKLRIWPIVGSNLDLA